MHLAGATTENTMTARNAYACTPHKTMEELEVMAAQRVVDGESADVVIQDIVDGYGLAWQSMNHERIKTAVLKEEQAIAVGWASSKQFEEHRTQLESRLDIKAGSPVKEIGWAYPTSPAAVEMGFARTGCYVLNVGTWGTPLKAIAGATGVCVLIAQGETLEGVWTPYSMV